MTAIDAVREMFPNFPDLIATAPDLDSEEQLRKAETIGRPLGDQAFLDRLESLTDRKLRPEKRGQKSSKIALSPQ